MELREIGEFGFIRRVSRGCLIRPEGVERSIGDDAAAIGAMLAEVADAFNHRRLHVRRCGVHFLERPG